MISMPENDIARKIQVLIFLKTIQYIYGWIIFTGENVFIYDYVYIYYTYIVIGYA